MTLTVKERRKELKPARLFAFKLWEENPKITAAVLDKALKEKGFEVKRTTGATWLSRFRKGSRIRTSETKRRLERKPKQARLFAFKLWGRNPEITAAVLGQVLQEEGFQVKSRTCYSWLNSFREGKEPGTYEEKPPTAVRSIKQHPGRKPNPARLLAFKLWEKNPKITAAELDRALRKEGFQQHISTFYLWLNSFREGKEPGTYEEKPPTAVKPGEITLEQLIKAVGSIEALSLLFYQGVMEEVRRRDSAYDVLKQECLKKDELISRLRQELEAVTRERNKIIREFNEKIAKVKVGTLTLDQVEHRLIPKDYPHNEPRRF